MSKILTRYLEHHIQEDLKTKMVFLGGPRQVGKTTLAQKLIKNYIDGIGRPAAAGKTSN